MTDSNYRPSGRRKGTWLLGAERGERVQKAERAYAKHIDTARIHFHCTNGRCAAPLRSIVFDQQRMEDAVAIWHSPVAILACEYGHEQRVTL